MDSKLNERNGIWSLTSKTNLQKIEIDYIPFGKKDVHKNQVIFYNDKGILDSLHSKFYTSEIKNDENKKFLKLNFFSPQNSKEKFFRASIKYSIVRNSEKIKENLIQLKDENGRYRTRIDFDFKPKDEVFGYFSEFTTSHTIGDSMTIGNNVVYFQEKF